MGYGGQLPLQRRHLSDKEVRPRATRQHIEAESLWAARVAAATPFPDARLNTRLERLLIDLAAKPLDAFPQAAADWHQAKATYRFMANNRFAWEDLLVGWHVTTAASAYLRNRFSKRRQNNRRMQNEGRALPVRLGATPQTRVIWTRPVSAAAAGAARLRPSARFYGGLSSTLRRHEYLSRGKRAVVRCGWLRIGLDV